MSLNKEVQSHGMILMPGSVALLLWKEKDKSPENKKKFDLHMKDVIQRYKDLLKE